jgi:RNA polymerase sigma-70 factor (ECF subfamily)
MPRPSLALSNNPAATDRELVDAARQGNVNAYAVLVGRHQQRIFRLSVHLLKNRSDAEDVAQETFVRAYRALERFDGRCEPFTWIYRIAVNLSLNVLRARRVRKFATTDDDPRLEHELVEHRPGYADPAGESSDRQIAKQLISAMDTLSETLRTTLVLVCIDGLSHGDAAKVLGCPEGTVAWRVHEARRKLKEQLAARGVDVEEEP